MFHIRACLGGVLALVFLAAGNAGAAVPVIYNTGVDSTGAVLPNGSVDTHYIVGPGGPPVVSAVSANPPADTLSAWISPSTNFGAGSYNFSTAFTYTPGPITIQGQWAAYLSGLDISLNGVSTNDTTPVPGDSWTPFTITGTAIAGTNTLAFRPAENPSVSPTVGLRVEFTSITPEPASLALLGIGGVVLLTRRQRAATFH